MKNFFEINQKVIHKREGVAVIFSMSSISGKDYYILKTSRGDGENIYVPADGSSNIIRPIMTIDEAEKLLEYMSKSKIIYTPNTKQRRDCYKRMLNSCNEKDIALLAMQLRFYNKSSESENPQMKLGIMDIEMLKKANNILMDELALTFNTPREKIEEFIFNKIEK